MHEDYVIAKMDLILDIHSTYYNWQAYYIFKGFR